MLSCRWSNTSRVVSSCCFQSMRLRQMGRSAGEQVTMRLVTALGLSWLDYCNAVLAGLPELTIRPLQRVQKAAAQLITDTKQRDHVTPVLMRLHWLPIKLRIIYKLCLQIHLIHTNQRPDYMAEMIQFTTHSRHGLVFCLLELPPVPEASAESQVRWASLHSCNITPWWWWWWYWWTKLTRHFFRVEFSSVQLMKLRVEFSSVQLMKPTFKFFAR